MACNRPHVIGLSVNSGLCFALHMSCNQDLSGNRLASLPVTIGHLTRLTKLNLANNCLQTLPHEIGLLRSKHFSLYTLLAVAQVHI